jgi:hypothetical protein
MMFKKLEYNFMTSWQRPCEICATRCTHYMVFVGGREAFGQVISVLYNVPCGCNATPELPAENLRAPVPESLPSDVMALCMLES